MSLMSQFEETRSLLLEAMLEHRCSPNLENCLRSADPKANRGGTEGHGQGTRGDETYERVPRQSG